MPFRGLAYRHTRPAHADLAKTVAATARTAEPGRFHVKGEFGAVYLSLNPETAHKELVRRASRAGVSVSQLMPRDLLTVDLQLAKVLDLTDAAVRNEWGIHAIAITSDDYRPCQEIASAARRAGYEGIRYPSATGEGENVVVFLDRMHPGSHAVVVNQRPMDPEALPER